MTYVYNRKKILRALQKSEKNIDRHKISVTSDKSKISSGITHQLK